MRTLTFFLFLALAMLPGMAQTREVVKTLGDLNGDGVKETAIEEYSSGSGGTNCFVTVMSGKRRVLDFGLSGGTADGYRVVGRQIIVWQGDWWDNDNRLAPHYYNFYWYGWDPNAKKFLKRSEGFTAKAYSQTQAKEKLPKLLTKPGDQLLIYGDNDPAVSTIYTQAQKLPAANRDEFILKELGNRYVGWMNKNNSRYNQDRIKLYRITIYKGWAQVSFDSKTTEAGAIIYKRNSSGRWQMMARGNEFSGWIIDGTIPKDIAKGIHIS